MRLLTLLSFALVTLFSLSATNAEEGGAKLVKEYKNPDNPYDISYEKWKLPNGLTILIHEDHSDPIAHVQLKYHVGSAREAAGKSGFAHFFEHMMFGGSKHVEEDEHSEIVTKAGGEINAATSRDLTYYYQTVPSNQVETALWLESDRMGYFLPAVTKDEFETQRATVKNEKDQRVTNQPYGLTREVMAKTLYPKGHPYSWPTIGYVSDLDSVTLKDLKYFHLKYYNPNNAVLSIAGDVNPEQVANWAEKYFGPIPKGPKVKDPQEQTPRLPVNRYGRYTDDIYFPLTSMSFPTVPMYHKDQPALDVLASIMGQGESSLFYQEFVDTEDAIQASVNHRGTELSGQLSLQVLPYPTDGMLKLETHFQKIEQKINETIEKTEDHITEETVKRAKNSQIASLISNSKTSVSSKAFSLSQYEIFSDREDFNLGDIIRRYENVNPADVRRVYNKYIKNRNAAVVNVYPRLRKEDEGDTTKSENPYLNVEREQRFTDLSYEEPEDTIDRHKRPEPGEPVTPETPNYYEANFNNGLEVIGTKTTEVPKVLMRLDIHGGNSMLAREEMEASLGGMFSSSKDKMGLAGMTAQMMNQSTENYTNEEISGKLKELGSRIRFSGGSLSTTVYVESLTENIGETIKLLEEKLLRPGFKQADFDRIKNQQIEAMKSQKKNPGQMANDAFNKVLYENTILGEYSTEGTIDNIELEDVKQFYNKNYSPNLTDLTIVGDISKQEIMPKLNFLKDWENKNVDIPKINNFTENEETQIHLVHKPYTSQSSIRMGHLAPEYNPTGTYFKLNVMNFKLGEAGLNNRLQLNLREDKAYTYGIGSFFTGNKYKGRFTVFSDVKNTKTDSALMAIQNELNRYRDQGITKEELEFTKKSIFNNQALEYETPRNKASFLSRIIEYDLPKNFTDKQAEIVENMTQEEIEQLAKEYIQPDKMDIVIVGNKYIVKDVLEDLEMGDVNTLDLY